MGGMTRLLLLLWAGVTVGSVVDLQKRIFGGQQCPDNKRLYHVQLRKSLPVDAFVCGGSLISARWILTAAHCWGPRLYAVVGVHPGPGTPVNVKPHFFWDDQHSIHDIMLLKIIKPAPTGITPVSLPATCVNPPTARTVPVVQIAGHANTTVDPVTRRKETVDSDELLCADTNVVSCDPFRSCINMTNTREWNTNNEQQWNELIDERWLCFQRHGVDVSSGDSGGGVVDGGTIHGVIVLGYDYVCNPVQPAAAMAVCKYREWIDRTTAISKWKKIVGAVKGAFSRT